MESTAICLKAAKLPMEAGRVSKEFIFSSSFSKAVKAPMLSGSVWIWLFVKSIVFNVVRLPMPLPTSLILLSVADRLSTLGRVNNPSGSSSSLLLPKSTAFTPTSPLKSAGRVVNWVSFIFSAVSAVKLFMLSGSVWIWLPSKSIVFNLVRSPMRLSTSLRLLLVADRLSTLGRVNTPSGSSSRLLEPRPTLVTPVSPLKSAGRVVN